LSAAWAGAAMVIAMAAAARREKPVFIMRILV
jgi:hypothetical protein